MRVITDDTIFHLQRSGGISRIYRETWPRMLDLDPTLAIDVLTSGGPPSIPQLPRLVPRPALPGLLDRAMRPIKLTWPVRGELSALLTRRGFGEPAQALPTEAWPSLWHSTYYSAPVAWRGSTVVMFYGVAPERTTVVHLAADAAFSEDRPAGSGSVPARPKLAHLSECFVFFIGSRPAYKNFHRVLCALEPLLARGGRRRSYLLPCR